MKLHECTVRTVFASLTRRRPRRGLTVLEILVAATLAMVIIIAMVQIFARAGSAISRAKASLEMSGQLRMTANRLSQDLRALTVPALPWASMSHGLGYFEYLEGPSKDRDVAPDGTNDSTQFDAKGRLGGLESDLVGVSVGDLDDVLMFTARSDEEPFVGRVDGSLVGSGAPFVTITSPIAEIVWWTRLNDTNGNDVWDAGETVTVHRRVLLVRPDLNQASGVLPPVGTPPLTTTPDDMRKFYNQNDLSIRPHRDSGGTLDGFAANSLADLTIRENRFAHYPVTVGSPSSFGAAGSQFPNEIDRRVNSPTSLQNLAKWDQMEKGADMEWGDAMTDDDNNGIPDDISEAGWPGSDDIIDSRRGEDVILSNVVAFDVRAFDPNAPIIISGATVVSPGDPGYDPDPGTQSITDADATTITTAPVGFGAFVDLNYANEPLDGTGAANTTSFDDTSGQRLSAFSGIPAFDDANDNEQRDGAGERFLGTSTATYCTWSTHYEADGRNQDGDAVTDEGTDGLDNDSQNGVDDPGEYETSPPYPLPLRGIQVRFRVVEIDTKQVRQTSVVSDFTPE